VTARLDGQELQLAEIPVAVPGVRRFGIAGAGTALATATRATIVYTRGALSPIESTWTLPISSPAEVGLFVVTHIHAGRAKNWPQTE
jgi:hypothetical protein